jgi:hypothetical protein
MKEYSRVEIQLQVFLTLAMDEGNGKLHAVTSLAAAPCRQEARYVPEPERIPTPTRNKTPRTVCYRDMILDK